MSLFGGFDRIISASKNSADGLLVLRKEPAARQEMIFGGLAVIILIVLGCPLYHILIFAILLLIILATETLNSAIEEIVDRVSPEISDFGKKTKDLGSLAVAFTLIAAGLYWLYAVAAAFDFVS
ncbi:MAG: diacylglycerol kinase [Rhizobiaceae bacterium]|nr:diacylglycerol kinase [Rhizobiaceae bacterium]